MLKNKGNLTVSCEASLHDQPQLEGRVRIASLAPCVGRRALRCVGERVLDVGKIARTAREVTGHGARPSLVPAWPPALPLAVAVSRCVGRYSQGNVVSAAGCLWEQPYR